MLDELRRTAEGARDRHPVHRRRPPRLRRSRRRPWRRCWTPWARRRRRRPGRRWWSPGPGGRQTWSPPEGEPATAGAGRGRGTAPAGRAARRPAARAGTGSRAGPAPPPWWSRPGAATCRRSWTAVGAPGAGRPSCTRSARGPAGASATSRDLAGLLAATAPLGAGFALLNPLHAALPTEPSPYNPSSRVFRNPLYLRVEDVPELAALGPEERARVEALAAAGRGLLDQDRIDRPAVYRLKDEALRLAHAAIDRVPGRRDGLAAYTRRHREPGAVRHLLRPPARPRQRLARLAGQLPPSQPARGGRLRPASTATRSATTPGSSGCSTSSWRPSGRAGGSSGW